MSSIKIVCRKEIKNKGVGDTKDNTIGDELIIESSQLFMNTREFFNTVKDSLTKYFDSIEKKQN